MKRLAAAAAVMLMVGTPGLALAATLRPIDSDGLNLRAGPGTDRPILATLPEGQSVTVIGQQDGWYKVRTASGLEAWAAGWVSRVFFTDEEAYAIVDTDILNVRREPSLTAPVLTKIYQDQKVRLLEMAGDWWRVRTGDIEGWVAAQYVKRAATATPPGAEPPAGPPATPPADPTGEPPAGEPEPPEGEPEPPAPAPEIPATPPPAPEGTVPVLPFKPLPAPRPAGEKMVQAVAASTVYAGRDKWAFDWTGSIKPGEQLIFLDAAEGWVQVRTPRGEQGWVPGQTVVMTEGEHLFDLKEGYWSLGFTADPGGVPDTGPGKDRRAVRDPDGLRLRKGPSTETEILTVLQQGDVMEVLEVREPWLRVNTSAGATGWVHGEFTVPVPGVGPVFATRPAFADDFRATLQEISPGILQLEVQSVQPLGEPVGVGTSLAIPVTSGHKGTATLPVEDAGVRRMTVSPTGLILELSSLPGWQEVERTENRLVLLLRPIVAAAAVTEQPDRTIYSFEIAGPVAPRTAVAGDDVVLEFPGATLAEGFAVAGARAEATEAGVRVLIPTRRPFALKRTATGFDLHVYQPGLAGKTILLDPGHGGWDAGAWNPDTGVREKHINLEVALRLRAALAERGATVLMTRATDSGSAPAEVIGESQGYERSQKDMGYRTRMANELGVDLFVSIHHNSGGGDGGQGSETFYTIGTLNGERSRALARLIQAELPVALDQVNRGAKDELYYVTRNTEAPAVLVEVAYLDHPVEGNLVDSPEYQERAVAALVRALEAFYAERGE